MNPALPRKKKLLYVITKSNWGGAQRYVYDLATAVPRDRLEVTVLVGGDGPLISLLEHAGIRVRHLTIQRDVSYKGDWAAFVELYQHMKEVRPDIVHLNSSKVGGLGGLAARLLGVPRIIFTAHGWAFNEDRPLLQKLPIALLHAFTVLCSHKTIAVSRALAKQLNWPLLRNRFKVIHPGRTIGVMYEKNEARDALIQFSPALAPHKEKTWILTIAELHAIKRIPVLIEALALLRHTNPNLISVIIGEGEERARLQAQIDAATLTDTVFLIGSITEAARFLHAADMFVLPSKSESYGYVVHEAGAVGVPVIASAVGGILDIVPDNRHGILLPPGDSSLLAAAIAEVATNGQEASERALRLKTFLASRTVARMAAATVALYELPL